MHTAVMVIFVLNAVTLIGIVLIQQGKGADAGAAFGSGASATVFGARGSANFLSRFTAVLATLFFVLAMVLAFMDRDVEAPRSLTERMPLTDYSADPQPTEGPQRIPNEVPASAASSVDDQDQSRPEQSSATGSSESQSSANDEDDPDPI